ncbi:MAG: zinc ABC transporter substrate-binding protein [Oligoflexia bacterium]|nr:zinc ABC transporter substrate-binding protein [Oligoflexia bacterium]MBF0364179.1 zinc ABC transporter substrate-binding protein [Oligoflexia bacterium]
MIVINRVVILFLLLLLFPLNISAATSVFVSILPLKFFVDKIVEDKMSVSVMVEPGHGPETYSPGPKQMEALGKAKLYLHLGLPFEKVLVKKIAKINHGTKVVNVREGIEAVTLTGHGGHGDHGDHGDHEDDPHIWSSPRLTIKMVEVIAKELLLLAKEQKVAAKELEAMEVRAKKLQEELLILDGEIKSKLGAYRGRQFLAYHPAWGYFAHDYGLKQLSIEMHGKSPGPRDLLQLSKIIKESKIKTMFMPKQLNRSLGKSWEESNKLAVKVIDPLAYDYFVSIREFCGELVKSFE